MKCLLAIYTREAEGFVDTYHWQIEDEEGNVLEGSDEYDNKNECKQDGKDRLSQYNKKKTDRKQIE